MKKGHLQKAPDSLDSSAYISLAVTQICGHIYLPEKLRNYSLFQAAVVSHLDFYCLRGKQEKGMATHSSILAWRIPWTEEPSGLQSMGYAKSQTRLSD